MRIDTRKKIRNVAGENIIIRQDANTADMTTVVGLNNSALLLYNSLKDRDFSIADAAAVLIDEYDVDQATAKRDAAAWTEQMKNQGLII